MLILDGANDSLYVYPLFGSDVEVHASWVDNNAGTLTPGRTNTASITTATNTVVVAAPGSGVQRAIGFLSVRNNHASAVEGVYIAHYDGTEYTILCQCVLFPGGAVVLTNKGKFVRYTANAEVVPALGTLATQAVAEAASSTTDPMTAGTAHYHPGMPKCWCKVDSAASVQGSYNMTSVTDVGVGFATFNIATDFSSASWCAMLTIDRQATALAVADRRHVAIVNAGQAAGTLAGECWDGTATTALVKDPTYWHLMGLGDHA